MRMIAGSLDAHAGFLHAGYISAHPRTADYGIQSRLHHGLLFQSPEEFSIINLTRALTLGDVPAKAAESGAPARLQQPGALAPGLLVAGELGTLAVTLVFFALLAWLQLRRQRAQPEHRVRGLLSGLVLAAGIALGAWCWWRVEVSALSATVATWSNVPVRQYADPQAATEAILHGLIAEALSKKPAVRSLAEIADEVVLPLKPAELTPGQRYAVATYGRDGWGREFRLANVSTANPVAIVRSAGADGAFNTADDLVMECAIAGGSVGWERRIPGLYVRHFADGYKFLVHRVPDKLFRFKDAKSAENLTGGAMFDVFEVETMMDGVGRPSAGADGREANPLRTWFDTVKQMASPEEQPAALVYVWPKKTGL